jgi:hypothetical protein
MGCIHQRPLADRRMARCADRFGQFPRARSNNLHRNGTTRYVPLCATVKLALSELSVDIEQRYRRRARALIPAGRAGIGRCRELTAQWLSEWSRMDFIHVASLVAAELVEAALSATDTEFVLRLETDGSTVSVAVQHVGIANPVQRNRLTTRLPGRSGRREFADVGGLTRPCPATPLGRRWPRESFLSRSSVKDPDCRASDRVCEPP